MRSAASALLLLSACATAPADRPPVSDDGSAGGGAGGACASGKGASALAVADRKIAGDAAPYTADGTMRARDAELASSQRARREAAWKTVEKVLAPIPLAEPLENLPAGVPRSLPAWQTWYGRDELARVFHRTYGALDPAAREARNPLDPAELDAAFAWNTDVVEELPSWPADRWLAYVASIDTETELHGLGGVGRVAYAPAAARHLLSSYGQVLDCRESGAPGAHVEGPPVTETVQRERAALEACASRVFGPYAIDDDESLRATLDAPGVRLTWHRTPDDPALCDARDPGCAPSGKGTFVLIASADVASEGELVVQRESRHPAWATCVDGPFPVDAVVIKADWRRAQFEMKLPVFDTSAASLASRLTDGTLSWDVPDGEADPGADAIYTIGLEAGPVYRLAGLHIMTKELDHWQWITLWWSDTPDQDFGADRPPSIGGVWSRYKMCVTTSFTEEDADARGGYGGDASSLGDALAAVHRGKGAPSWCSNPYVELGPNNAATNCIGCHQHAGTDLLAETIISDETRFPSQGRAQVRNNFPTDYSWAVNSGDLLQQLFADEEAYWASE